MRLLLTDYYKGPLGLPGETVNLPAAEGRELLETAVDPTGKVLTNEELAEVDARGEAVHPGYPQAMWLPTDAEVKAEKVAVAARKAAAVRGR